MRTIKENSVQDRHRCKQEQREVTDRCKWDTEEAESQLQFSIEVL